MASPDEARVDEARAPSTLPAGPTPRACTPGPPRKAPGPAGECLPGPGAGAARGGDKLGING